MPTARKRQARSTTVRTALLDAALVEFASNGFDGASTRVIATRAGTHQPQINYHFDSKDALWRAAVDHLYARLDDLAGEIVPPVDDTDPGELLELLAAGLRRFVHAVARLPELNQIMIQEATADSERLAWIVERHSGPRFAALTATWTHLADARLVAAMDPVVLYYSLIGAASLLYVNAPEARRLIGGEPIDDRRVEAHADALIAMFLRPPMDHKPNRSTS